MPVKDPNLSPVDRILASRRRTFIRDWILVLIALGLAISAGVFRSDRSPSEPSRHASPAAFVR